MPPDDTENSVADILQGMVDELRQAEAETGVTGKESAKYTYLVALRNAGVETTRAMANLDAPSLRAIWKDNKGKAPVAAMDSAQRARFDERFPDAWRYGGRTTRPVAAAAPAPVSRFDKMFPDAKRLVHG